MRLLVHSSMMVCSVNSAEDNTEYGAIVPSMQFGTKKWRITTAILYKKAKSQSPWIKMEKSPSRVQSSATMPCNTMWPCFLSSNKYILTSMQKMEAWIAPLPMPTKFSSKIVQKSMISSISRHYHSRIKMPSPCSLSRTNPTRILSFQKARMRLVIHGTMVQYWLLLASTHKDIYHHPSTLLSTICSRYKFLSTSWSEVQSKLPKTTTTPSISKSMRSTLITSLFISSTMLPTELP